MALNQAELEQALREVNDGKLLRAAAVGDTAAIKLLLSGGANIHYLDDSPLRIAALNGHTNAVEALLAGGADPHAHNDESLSWAGINGHGETYGVLLKALSKQSKFEHRDLRPPDLSPN